MSEVFARRMRGRGVFPSHPAAVESWLGHLPRPRASAGDAAAIERGRALFAGQALCGRCHSGPTLTNGQSRDVGTGGAFQVPSLVGVADRLPVMHDGCATTLERRFDPSCGGAEHGPALSDAQRADLIAYWESL